ncbi:hypothetical protein GOP47_0021283 [Adiantum capillus-veneris]|uniref:Uncharacterized protein n=1 Tax=Adiantum capillus-veneris TaxID=13818 RepID=A0A9D4Z6Y7_ADICA|nr:hypothetical protein GOP47_0021283 [Adiantum capillus-veneris]
MMMMRSSRILQQQRPDPCLHSSLHKLGTMMAQNASSAACQHAYGYVRRHHEGGSPIPYLLAGLAAMLALIAISLFILACSYWKLVGCVEQHAAARAANYSTTSPATTQNNNNNTAGSGHAPQLMQDESCTKLVVIMAGHDKPTFIAQPVGIVFESTPSSTPPMKV